MDLAKPSVLLVEDDAFLLEAIAITLQSRGYRVEPTADGNDAMALIDKNTFDIAILDMMLPGQSGFPIAQRLKDRLAGQVFVVMMSGNTSAAHRDYALASGVDRFLAKPFAMAKLLETLEKAESKIVPRAKINGARVRSLFDAIPA